MYVFQEAIRWFICVIIDKLIAFKNICMRLTVWRISWVWDERLGITKKISAMDIHKDQNVDKLYLSQKKYLEKVL